MPNIFSITVTYNPDLLILERQINSLIKENIRLIIIDNGSNNQSDIINICDKYDIVNFNLEKNEGLAFAQNLGAEKAIAMKADYFILFDQDSVVNPGFIDSLYSTYIKLSSKGEKVGAVGPSFYDPYDGKKYPPTRYVGPLIKKIKEQDLATRVTFLIASGSLIPVENYKLIGPFTNELFVDYIDVEWSLRCKKYGYNVYMIGNALMAHTIGDKRKNILGRTVSVHSPVRRYYLIRNSLYMLRLSYIPFGYKLRELSFNFLRCIVAVIYSDNRMNTLRFIFLGLKHGMLGKYGKGI